MTDFDRRLEDLFAGDARARRVRGVGVPPRRSGWPAVAALIAATAVTTVLAVLVLGTLRSGLDGAASPSAVASPGPAASGTPGRSADHKSIVVDGQVLLAIDDDRIVNWFRTESQLCDQRNIGSTPDRRMFCTNKATFREQTRFGSVVTSPDRMKVGFTIESATLSPDTVAGVFLRSTGQVHFLTTYYLGSDFIGFSPTGTHFAYQGNCFEAKCSLFIRDSQTLAEKARLNDPAGGERAQNATFVRWISDNEVEYRLGTELRRQSF